MSVLEGELSFVGVPRQTLDVQSMEELRILEKGPDAEFHDVFALTDADPDYIASEGRDGDRKNLALLPATNLLGAVALVKVNGRELWAVGDAQIIPTKPEADYHVDALDYDMDPEAFTEAMRAKAKAEAEVAAVAEAARDEIRAYARFMGRRMGREVVLQGALQEDAAQISA
jgi:hypothetical protein